MNKQDMILAISLETGLTQVESEKAINAMVNFIHTCVADGVDVKLMHLGTFSKIKKKSRRGHNPQTLKKIKIPSGWYPKFHAHEKFRALVKDSK